VNYKVSDHPLKLDAGISATHKDEMKARYTSINKLLKAKAAKAGKKWVSDVPSTSIDVSTFKVTFLGDAFSVGQENAYVEFTYTYGGDDFSGELVTADASDYYYPHSSKTSFSKTKSGTSFIYLTLDNAGVVPLNINLLDEDGNLLKTFTHSFTATEAAAASIDISKFSGSFDGDTFTVGEFVPRSTFEWTNTGATFSGSIQTFGTSDTYDGTQHITTFWTGTSGDQIISVPVDSAGQKTLTVHILDNDENILKTYTHTVTVSE